jgi:fibronectin-binding autotransporter adhesin
MISRSWVRSLFARTPRTVRKAPARFRPRVEALEDRVTPTTYTVTSLAGDNSAGSLRQAIALANAQPGKDTITFASGLAGGAIDLSTGQLSITGDVDIKGPTAALVILDGPSFDTFQQFMNNGRIFDIAAGVTASISNLRLQGGNASDPNFEGNTPDAFGGAIHNAGNLTGRQCTFYNNGAGDYDNWGNGGGGAIYNSGTLTVVNSSFAANYAVYGSGGGIYNAGTATVSDSTFYRNYNGGLGGAIYNAAGANATVNSCTMTQNGGDSSSEVLGRPLKALTKPGFGM